MTQYNYINYSVKLLDSLHLEEDRLKEKILNAILQFATIIWLKFICYASFLCELWGVHHDHIKKISHCHGSAFDCIM